MAYHTFFSQAQLMPPIEELVQALDSLLLRVSSHRPERTAALHELLNNLLRPSAIYRLLSSRLTVIEVLYCLATLRKDKQIEQIDDTHGGLLRLCGPAAEAPPSPSLGLHLIDDDAVQARDGFREILTDLLADKKSAYSQSVETYETLVRRYKMMQAFGDLHHRSLLLLGDDALFSLFLAVHGYKQRVVVADIDADLLNTIARVAYRQGFHNIEVVQHDMLRPLPEQLRGRFDCFAVNGFKDVGGLMMFVCRALESVAEPTGLRAGYLNYGNHEMLSAAQVADEFRIHTLLNQFGVFIDYSAPCPETHVNVEFCRAFARSVHEASEVQDDTQRWQVCESILLQLKQQVFGHLSWVAMDNFPRIQLSPLKMARCRIHECQWPEIRKFARLGQMYAGRQKAS